MRAHDIVTRLLLEQYHPLAVAKTLLGGESFRRFAHRVLLDLRYPAPPTCSNSQPQAIATEVFYRQTLLEVVESWLVENKLSPDELCCPPPRADESCASYCPRCEAQFVSVSGTCSDCGGLPLMAFRKAS
jgi:hypothetical protein